MYDECTRTKYISRQHTPISNQCALQQTKQTNSTNEKVSKNSVTLQQDYQIDKSPRQTNITTERIVYLTWTGYMIAGYINAFGWGIKGPFKFNVWRICINTASYLCLFLFCNTVNTWLIRTTRWCIWNIWNGRINNEFMQFICFKLLILWLICSLREKLINCFLAQSRPGIEFIPVTTHKNNFIIRKIAC